MEEFFGVDFESSTAEVTTSIESSPEFDNSITSARVYNKVKDEDVLRVIAKTQNFLPAIFSFPFEVTIRLENPIDLPEDKILKFNLRGEKSLILRRDISPSNLSIQLIKSSGELSAPISLRGLGYIDGITPEWQEVSIPLEAFKGFSDLKDIIGIKITGILPKGKAKVAFRIDDFWISGEGISDIIDSSLPESLRDEDFIPVSPFEWRNNDGYRVEIASDGKNIRRVFFKGNEIFSDPDGSNAINGIELYKHFPAFIASPKHVLVLKGKKEIFIYRDFEQLERIDADSYIPLKLGKQYSNEELQRITHINGLRIDPDLRQHLIDFNTKVIEAGLTHDYIAEVLRTAFDLAFKQGEATFELPNGVRLKVSHRYLIRCCGGGPHWITIKNIGKDKVIQILYGFEYNGRRIFVPDFVRGVEYGYYYNTLNAPISLSYASEDLIAPAPLDQVEELIEVITP